MLKYKIGIIGVGNISKIHMQGIKAHPERAEIIALCDPNLDALEKAAKDFHLDRVYTDLSMFISENENNLDAVVVCTPTIVRKDVLFPLINAGIPILCEKPFAESYEEAKEILDYATEKNVKIAVNQNFRYNFPFEEARKLIKEGAIGKPVNILLYNLFFRQDKGWRVSCKHHAMSVMGIHWLDGFRWMLDCEAEKLNCLTLSSSAIECVGETDSNTQLQFENGTMITYIQSFSSTITKTDMLVIGEAGSMQLDFGNIIIHRKKDAEDEIINIDCKWEFHDTMFQCLNNLLEWIETGKEASNSMYDNIKTVTLLDAAYMSAEEKRTIFLNKGEIVL